MGEICSFYNISLDSITRWKYHYEKYEVEGLNESKHGRDILKN